MGQVEPQLLVGQVERVHPLELVRHLELVAPQVLVAHQLVQEHLHLVVAQVQVLLQDYQVIDMLQHQQQHLLLVMLEQ
jgi:hypothetical protein